MLEALKSLFENNAISEEIRADIQKAWDDQIAENNASNASGALICNWPCNHIDQDLCRSF